MHSGHLEIDNNQMENTIRPVALDRKNLHFAGSHAAAENIAIYRWFFATCHANGVNPYDWLRTVLLRINSTAPD
ncbi:MAG: IS66 family transposase [Candidatus Kapabacteria bacterium]|nr:IS66 family transposase [Candidatus Kapabacteria bacterium]